MLVRELMTRSVSSLPVNATINDVIRLLTTERISCVPVVDGDLAQSLRPGVTPAWSALDDHQLTRLLTSSAPGTTTEKDHRK